MCDVQLHAAQSSVYTGQYTHVREPSSCRELVLSDNNKLLVENERHVLLDCQQRFIKDVVAGLSVSTGSTLQFESCELREFNFSGSADVSGGSILVDNSFVVIANCSVCLPIPL